ncbi:Pyridine nucleotide-disulfide oxidoreductase / selenide, water dikinase [Sulfitobacter donghicola DSW-25 = KCTC 12864 = JCM 14565]|uniref:Segregation protein B n=2 Tax=Sulfitobacter TaxID=60136 RepID=A0A073IXN9_9RHOB|nr:segregation protein B [Sulfitobacter donghicola DSW-25 = KCTC 12864 = JCM 14565]KIN66698.1 Pyridine nucleotide-disulfide oxidoreductase / selenide, water dikinase [Sulfitobacter donghicola DSW-25 = KCTC 12864 = JCM 14565]
MHNTTTFTRDLVFIGGGHAHALVLRKWGMNPLPGARLTVINPGPTAPYTGMLPGHIAGHYDRDTLEIDLVRLARFAGARLILSHATGIDRVAKTVSVEGRAPLSYDVASIDIGITARMDIDGFAQNAVGAKPLDIYAREWRDFLAAVQSGQKEPSVAVIGGGVAGCELAMAMAFSLRQSGAKPQVTVIESGPEISGVGAPARAKLAASMIDMGITFLPHAQIERIAAGSVVIKDQPAVQAALCVGAAGAFPHPWVATTDLPLAEGFIVVDPDLRVKGDETLFAVGDCAHMPFAPRPKAGVFAVRAAPVLHHNMRAVLTNGPLKPFKPQSSYLKLISLGGKSAMAEKYGFAPAGPLLWKWKDKIDRSFMNQLDELPLMAQQLPPSERALGADEAPSLPLCGGCGAKVGSEALKQALSALPQAHAPEIVTGAGDDAAVIRQSGGGFQVISVDHLRAFILDPVQMARIAAVHALGDIWAMGAAPQTALSSIILPRMSAALQERTLKEINAAAGEIFAQAGASIVGGHTTMGAEMTIGFTLTGTKAEMPLTVATAQDGDVLVLTRPIGSGVILAAHMAGAAPAATVTKALAQMEQPQIIAAKALQHANAMTDTTGFGLAGHVQEICKASGLQAELWHKEIPFYDGAQALSQAGFQSSLLSANIAAAPTSGISDPLLHDPQTAGGLLAALPKAAAEQAISEMAKQGQEAVIIGQLTRGEAAIKVS